MQQLHASFKLKWVVIRRFLFKLKVKEEKGKKGKYKKVKKKIRKPRGGGGGRSRRGKKKMRKQEKIKKKKNIFENVLEKAMTYHFTGKVHETKRTSALSHWLHLGRKER